MKYKLNGEWVDINIKALDSMPIGSIILFAGYHTIPTGWLVCDGSVMDKYDEANYPLFAAIGYTYGNDGQNFKLPDLRGRVPVGLKSSDTDFDTLGETGGEKKHTLTIDEIPSHQHYANIKVSGSGDRESINGDISISRNIANQDGAKTSATGGGQAHNNLQPYQVLNYIIKAYNTVPTMANVVNTRSESFAETYSTFMVNSMVNNLKPVTLYDDSGGTSGNITLNDNINNYSYIEIYAKWYSDFSLPAVKLAVGKINNNKFTISFNTTNGGHYIFYAKLYTISGTSITKEDFHYYITDTGETSTWDVLNIVKVVGYK